MSGRFPQPGKVFEEKYRVERLLGSGGFARVYLAEQTDLGRQVALKVLSPKVSQAFSSDDSDPQIESVALRFEREARVVSQLKSPQTVTMYDYGRTASGLLYMVMEFVDGVGLDELDVPIAPRRVVKILKQMLQSLQEAHASGLLHRDLKPANIMVYEHLGEKDHVKLLDFGIAKTVGEAANEDAGQADLTAADSLIGTPRYMSPEQIRGAEVGPPSDIYSLGLVVYELLVGEKAITSSDSIEILGQHLSADAFEIPPTQPVHPRLRRLVNRMLAKEVDQRYASTREVLEDLLDIEKIDGDLDQAAPSQDNPPTETIYDFDFDEDSIEDFGAERKSKKRGLIFGVFALLLLSGSAVGIWQLLREPAADPQPEQPASSEPLAALEAPEQEQPEAQVDDAGADEPDSVITLIRTKPEGASVWLGGELAGMAPVQFGSSDYEFPLTVRATFGDRSVERTIEGPGGEIWMEMPEPEALVENDEEEAADPEPRPTRQPKVDKPERTSKSSGSRPKRSGARKSTAAKKPKPEPEPEPAPKPEPEPKKEVETRTYLPLE